MKKIFFLTITLLFGCLSADNITVINHTDNTVWIGIYRIAANLWGNSVGNADLQGNIVSIPANERTVLNRPTLKRKINREIIFSETQGYLKEKFDHNEYKLVNKAPIGIKHGSTFHIAQRENVLHGYSDLEWKLVKPIIDTAHQVFDRMIDDIRKNAANHPYGKTKAFVRRGTDLAPQEINFLNERMPKVKQTLEKLLGISLTESQVPRIAVCMSGGGMRAATDAEGLFEGLNSIGLLDALTYAAGLSGSTWTLASLAELGFKMDEYSQHFIQALSAPHVFRPSDLAHVLWPKYVFGEHTSIVDLYGVFLAHTFFHNIKSSFARQDIHLSDSQRYLAQGDLFFPIYTAIEVKREILHWASFTPYEFGIDDLDIHIPIWSFGRKFEQGISTNFAPEQSLGFLMGIWGSALCGAARDILKTQAGTIPSVLLKAINDFSIQIGVSGIKVAAIKIFNPLRGCSWSSFRNVETINLMDSGYDFNLPFPPLLKKERKVDIIIVMDASAEVSANSPALQKAAEYAKSRTIPFPQINFDSIAKKQISIFTDKKNTAAPTIIFLTPVKNEKYNASFDPQIETNTTYSTVKFIYGKSDVKRLIALIKQNIIDNKEKILDAIRDKIKQKGTHSNSPEAENTSR